MTVQKRNKKPESHIVSLAPVTNSDREEAYEPFLDKIFTDDSMLNIAITAPKGAGKSSILSTYIKKHEFGVNPIKALNISVAMFEKNDDEQQSVKNSESTGITPRKNDDRPQPLRRGGNTGTTLENNVTTGSEYRLLSDSQMVEIKIMNQIIHQTLPSKIPASRFHIDREHKWYKSLARACWAIVMALCIFELSFLPYFRETAYTKAAINETSRAWAATLSDPISVAICTIILAFGVFLGVIIFFVNYAHKKLPRFSIKDCSVEPTDFDNDSMFNKYLDEILYILINSGYNTVVFEDIERLNDGTIWDKLREINILLNKRFKIMNPKKYVPIRFIYVTTDSIFKGKDRVKFFDYILPIIPVLDKKNSLDVILNKAEKHGFKLNQAYLGSINDCIDDMRMLINIFNEMSVYKELLSENVIDDDRLFAVLLYKNLLPYDYEKFIYNEGVLYSILSKIDYEKKQALDDSSISISEKETIVSDIPAEYFGIIKKDFDKEYKQYIDAITIDSNQWTGVQNRLVKYLIAQGYLSMNTMESISYTYNYTVTEQETLFIKNVKQNKETPYDTYIHNYAHITQELKGYFNSKYILNYCLVEYMFTSLEIHLQNILRVIKHYEIFDFVDGFIKYLERKGNTKVLSEFIIKLSNLWPEMFDKLNRVQLKKKYIELLLVYSNKELLEKLNKKNAITDFLNNTKSLMQKN